MAIMKRLRLKVQYLLITGMLVLLFVPLSSYAEQSVGSEWLRLVDTVNGDIMDVSTGKILYELGIKDRKSGKVISVPYNHHFVVNGVEYGNRVEYGLLTSHGAILAIRLLDGPGAFTGLFEWRDGNLEYLGKFYSPSYVYSSSSCWFNEHRCNKFDVPVVNQNYALFIHERNVNPEDGNYQDLILRNLESGTNEIIPMPTPGEHFGNFVLTENGEVYFNTNKGMYKYVKGTVTPLDDKPTKLF
ncbi:hypothetical protein [Paenibacillus sp. PL91]|uniref:hypothetical protein n=1 Tax=Paenibacillus sp. PL91 TaxID=2729538 RepID=UPI00145D0EF9|nr:hypothetical protein [Paenibacillus sp. PL91]MBC9199291.1 hypothetical protein [Paenibacillus sp. PL91]